ncbi:DUF1295-domain-containing protein [Guyanagaster necrorhizus]|uniref:DUF1295-domain-containing protein n=1 Tax=Guyanagaster necrorhizus TaxID=856835 RepID=A0A9P8AWT5_9AGAR|nr:DUF1295-domain-containing protein [Guyanagaster necrorhizus MCA 3950]KAG7451024.1 DUF1295-domain-containing protein [Guyanagaster necrorhizus MCA 3950]
MVFLPPPSWTEFAWPLQFCAFVAAATYIASIVTANVSQVDRLWTFLPPLYSAYFALLPLWPKSVQPFPLCPYVPRELVAVASDYSPRAVLMLALEVIWMFRLSYNTYRRGLFSLKDEDYRWAVLRTQLPAWFFQVMNLVFISGIQNVLLLSLGIPAYIAAVQQPHSNLALSDVVLALSSLVMLCLEFIADNQQYAFHAYKHSYLKGTGDYAEKKQWVGARLNWIPADAKRGFVTRGLWAYSRHPNFTCEQLFWWMNTFFPVAAQFPLDIPLCSFSRCVENVFHIYAYLTTTPVAEIFRTASSFWPLLPAASLSLLFIASTKYTEQITKSKYPSYTFYQKRVAMFGFIKTMEMSLYYKLRGGEQKKQIEKELWGSDTGKVKQY